MFLLETDRVTITEFTPDMAQAVHENSLDEDNRRFLPDEVFETVEEASETIRFLMAQYGCNEGPFVYPVHMKNGVEIGHVQAVPMEDGNWEIGFHIGGRYTGNGYATEAVSIFLPEIMKQLGIQKIIGICVLENKASRRVMEKCGFIPEYEGNGLYQGIQRGICRYIFIRDRDENHDEENR